MEISCYTFKRVVRVKSSEVYLILISKKCKVHIISKIREYVTLIVCKSKLIKSNKKDQPTLISPEWSGGLYMFMNLNNI